MYKNIFDTHAHYDDERFNEDRDELLSSLFEGSVSHIINCGCDLKSSLTTIELAEKFDNLYAAIGVHAHEAEACTSEDLAKGTPFALKYFANALLKIVNRTQGPRFLLSCFKFGDKTILGSLPSEPFVEIGYARSFRGISRC